jgi:Amidase
MTGHPVVTIPIGQSADGLPIGVQVVGRRWQEPALLAAAEQIATCADGYQRPPGYEPSDPPVKHRPGMPGLEELCRSWRPAPA